MKALINIGLATVLALSMSACGGISLKQQVSTKHQAVHQALVLVDDSERALCAPKPEAVNQCGSAVAASVGLTDAKHQQFSRLLATAYKDDAAAATAIMAWRAGDPVPSDVQTLLVDAQDILTEALTLTNQPIISKAQTLLARVQAAVAAFGK